MAVVAPGNKLNVVGQPLKRVDNHEKVTGQTKYVGDMKLHNMLYAKILRSPHAHARIIRLDTGRAEALAGVKAVVTPADSPPDVRFGEFFCEDTEVLTNRVRFVGEEVAAVAAETEEIAEAAAALIEVEYQPLPSVFTAQEALQPGAPIVAPEPCTTNLVSAATRTLSRERGSIEKGFAEAEFITEHRYTTGSLQHVALETRASIAEWNAGRLTVWATSQTPFSLRDTLARTFGIGQGNVRVIAPLLGGGFGGKYQNRYPILAAMLAKKAGRPVYLRHTREEDMLAKIRPSTHVSLKIGSNKAGDLTAVHGTIVSNAGGYAWALATAGMTPLRGMLRCPNVRYDAQSVYTNLPATGEFRGVMNGVMTFALAQELDATAERWGMNPVELLKQVAIRTGDECSIGWEKEGVKLASCGLAECLDAGAQAIGWREKWQGWGMPLRVDGHRRVGIGVSPMTHHSANAKFTSGATAKLNIDGTVDFLTPVIEMGQGTVTTQTQVLAEASGIPFDDIYPLNADTKVVPLDVWGQVCSSSAHLAALAAKMCGEDLKQQLLKLARTVLETDEQLEIVGGNIIAVATGRTLTTVRKLAPQVANGMGPPILGKGSLVTPNWPQKSRDFGAHFAEVEVDTETGQIKILNFVAAHDIGKALNPEIVTGQIEGGVMMGISWAMGEEARWDSAGRPMALGYTDYKIPTFADAFPITPLIVEPIDPLGAYGAKGFGEGPNIPTPGAVANAIYNATGVRLRKLPMAPEDILKALEAAREAKKA